jgi:fluoride ion exporter CrcB/FEX
MRSSSGSKARNASLSYVAGNLLGSLLMAVSGWWAIRRIL